MKQNTEKRSTEVFPFGFDQLRGHLKSTFITKGEGAP